ncbi:MAG: signal peptidase I [Candidatus Aenigmarchaeota archaeon]|nr:signal peptidase I [Candidatus Aenigmarchaeota archaeon]
MKAIFVAVILAIVGCVSVPSEPALQGDALTQYANLLNEWNDIANYHAINASGHTLYFPHELSIHEAPCDRKMSPVIECGDIIIASAPAELKKDDVVSFTIKDSEAQAFTESHGGEIWRRIARISAEGYVMKADIFDSTHAVFVNESRMTKKMVGILSDAKTTESLEALPFKPVVESREQLLNVWNNFASSVYKDKLPNGLPLYYVKDLAPASISCATNSMKPAVECGDLVLEEAEYGTLKPGDIISFKIEPNESSGYLPQSDKTQYIMHRIYRIDENGAYITKGDNNPLTDVIYLKKENILGKVVAIFKKI